MPSRPDVQIEVDAWRVQVAEEGLEVLQRAAGTVDRPGRGSQIREIDE